ncbi:HNH endonuclease [Blastococcus sp. CT_GayMR19]|uniref:HNH endonuclease signature motif containing protein n=1 Tax=Blastococcus sp. CT_GayMR19 TaxID=2559608 RepID=UPI0010739668|nr:HNH endonuclease signature motif containing protein [Blastococcus sp. CT_GayMR19]TFV70780.1 HNH endonuclease [Blastococcus sp. CT_GayMR19]
MFEGGGFGVGLTVNQLDGPDCPDGAPVPPDPDRHPTRLGELMPVAARNDAALAEEMRRSNIADSRLWAYRVEMIVQLAYRRRDDRDRPAGTPGAASPSWSGTSRVPEGVSEFFPDEVAMIMNFSRGEATTLTAVAWTLIHQLPDTWAALADGELSWSRARAMAQEIGRYGPELDPHVVRTVEAVVLPQAAELSVTRLRSLIRTEVVRYDAEAAERRRRKAEAAADVFLRRSALEGMSEVVTVVPQPVAAAMFRMVDACARQAKDDGDLRPIGQIRAEAMAAMALRPWDDDSPAVTAELRVFAPLNSLLPDPAVPGTGGRPAGVAEVDGEPVTATHLRALLTALDAVCPGGLQAPTGGSLHLDLLGAGGGLLATLTRRELEQAVRRGCPQHPDGDCRCPVVQRPPQTASYSPTAAQRRWGRARDHGCRHPGCRNRSGWADLDHVVPHAEGGPTDCDNLCCLCRRHHRLKTHAPDWSFDLDADGALLVTTPSGVTRISRPPGSYLLQPFELGAPLPDAVLVDVAPF